MSAAAQAVETTNPQRSRMIHSCNFRYAGRLSNENARALTSVHEKFAAQVTNALQVYLGAALKLKFVSLEQKPTQDYIGNVAPTSFLVPCTMNVLQNSLLLEMDTQLVIPMIDLLLGGAGAVAEEEASRELTDIDEEIMGSVTSLMVKEFERTWRSLDLQLTSSKPIKHIGIPQIFTANEKLVLLMFEMELGETTGHLTIVLPASFVGYLLRHLKATQKKKLSSLHNFSAPSLKERMLDCKFTVAADVMQMRALVKDLVEIKPGSVLKLNAPVKAPGHLTVENVGIFESAPVRSGNLKASQVVARLTEPPMSKE
jgi:flagellar motor switch protein FliM